MLKHFSYKNFVVYTGKDPTYLVKLVAYQPVLNIDIELVMGGQTRSLDGERRIKFDQG